MSAQRPLELPSCAQCAAIGMAMPEMLLRMEADLGVVTTREFLHDYGGRGYSISINSANTAHMTVNRWLRDKIGWGTITVPKGPTSHRARQGWKIYQRLAAGQSLTKIVGDLQCHTRTVSIHRRALKQRRLIDGTSILPHEENQK